MLSQGARAIKAVQLSNPIRREEVRKKSEVREGFEPSNSGFADRRVSSSPPHHEPNSVYSYVIFNFCELKKTGEFGTFNDLKKRLKDFRVK